MFNNLFFQDNGGAKEATDDNTIWRMLSKATCVHGHGRTRRNM
jgi:hypothetical protein